MTCSLSLVTQHYSVQPIDGTFVKGYGFLSFSKNIGRNVSKNLGGKYKQKLLDHSKQSATDALKIPEKVIQKTAEATGDLIGNKLTKVPGSSPQNISEIITNKHDKEICKVRYISPEEGQEIIDNLC